MTADAPAQIFNIGGNHFEMGYQHGQQAKPLRPAILTAMSARFAQLAADGADEAFEALVAETGQLLHAIDPATTDLIRGLAAGLEIPFERLLRYNLVAFLRDALTTRPAPAEGCTTWAAAGGATRNGRPILAKNRDYNMEHLPLQVVVQAQPAAGYRYTFVTSAGSPGVFVAGINEAGLAVVDTHVSTPEVGPGLPTYALSMHLLEEQHSVRAALVYLQHTPRLGRNNLLLADAGGDIALFEMGHRHSAVIEAEDGLLVNANHFCSPTMQPFFVDTNPPGLRGNSRQRCETVRTMLTQAHGQIDLPLAQKIMAHHAGPLDSVCRHPLPEADTSTISATIFSPAERRLHFCHGQPCAGQYQLFEYGDTPPAHRR
jgi:isopenicillin-N N-acyltransferase-like protein